MMVDGAKRLVIVLWAAAGDPPRLAAAPFVYALAARALDLDVEIHYTSACARWLVPGVADAVAANGGGSKSVLDYIRETHREGVRHFACSMALAEYCRGCSLIPEVTGIAGAATVIEAATTTGVRTLVF